MRLKESIKGRLFNENGTLNVIELKTIELLTRIKRIQLFNPKNSFAISYYSVNPYIIINPITNFITISFYLQFHYPTNLLTLHKTPTNSGPNFNAYLIRNMVSLTLFPLLIQPFTSIQTNPHPISSGQRSKVNFVSLSEATVKNYFLGNPKQRPSQITLRIHLLLLLPPPPH